MGIFNNGDVFIIKTTSYTTQEMPMCPQTSKVSSYSFCARNKKRRIWKEWDKKKLQHTDGGKIYLFFFNVQIACKEETKQNC